MGKTLVTILNLALSPLHAQGFQIPTEESSNIHKAVNKALVELITRLETQYPLIFSPEYSEVGYALYLLAFLSVDKYI